MFVWCSPQNYYYYYFFLHCVHVLLSTIQVESVRVHCRHTLSMERPGKQIVHSGQDIIYVLLVMDIQ